MTEDIPLFKVYMHKDTGSNINIVLSSGMVTQSVKVEEFEKQLKEYFNYPYILTLNSATAGLTLAYRLLNLEKDDQVISTPMTCFATNAAILANNLDIVWADTDQNTCSIDLEDVMSKITEKTKVLSLVHWGGFPVDMDKLNKVKEYAKTSVGIDLNIVEDCAHAFGAEWNGKKLGTFGNIAVFSLQAIKHLTTGDGGLIFLPTKEMYIRAKKLRWYGIDREDRSRVNHDFRLENNIEEYGYKFHMNDINATIGLSNLPYVDIILNICRKNATYYDTSLSNISGIELFMRHNNAVNSPWIYTIKILNNMKDTFIRFMKDKKIVVSQVHARNDKNTCVEKYRTTLNKLDILETQHVSIPVGWWITDETREYIVNCIKEFFTKIVRNINIDEIDVYKEMIYNLNGYKSENTCVLTPEMIKEIYVVEVEGKIVATAKLIIENKLYESVGHIEDVVTDPNHRRCGHGKYIINKLTDIALNTNNCYKVTLSCKKEYEDFYTKCGLVNTGLSFTKYRTK